MYRHEPGKNEERGEANIEKKKKKAVVIENFLFSYSVRIKVYIYKGLRNIRNALFNFLGGYRID